MRGIEANSSCRLKTGRAVFRHAGLLKINVIRDAYPVLHFTKTVNASNLSLMSIL